MPIFALSMSKKECPLYNLYQNLKILTFNMNKTMCALHDL